MLGLPNHETSSGYSNSTAVGFEPVRRHFVSLQTLSAPMSRAETVSTTLSSAAQIRLPACSTERTALVRPRQTVCIASISHRVAPSEHFSHRSSAKRHWFRTFRPEPVEPSTLLFCSTHAAFLCDAQFEVCCFLKRATGSTQFGATNGLNCAELHATVPPQPDPHHSLTVRVR